MTTVKLPTHIIYAEGIDNNTHWRGMARIAVAGVKAIRRHGYHTPEALAEIAAARRATTPDHCRREHRYEYRGLTEGNTNLARYRCMDCGTLRQISDRKAPPPATTQGILPFDRSMMNWLESHDCYIEIYA